MTEGEKVLRFIFGMVTGICLAGIIVYSIESSHWEFFWLSLLVWVIGMDVLLAIWWLFKVVK